MGMFSLHLALWELLHLFWQLPKSFIKVMTWQNIVEWFSCHKALKSSDRNIIGFTIQESESNQYQTTQGMFNQETHQIIDGRIVESMIIDSQIVEIHRHHKLLIYQ